MGENLGLDAEIVGSFAVCELLLDALKMGVEQTDAATGESIDDALDVVGREQAFDAIVADAVSRETLDGDNAIERSSQALQRCVDLRALEIAEELGLGVVKDDHRGELLGMADFDADGNGILRPAESVADAGAQATRNIRMQRVRRPAGQDTAIFLLE